MRKTSLIAPLIFLIACSAAWAQTASKTETAKPKFVNLVVNPSFEEKSPDQTENITSTAPLSGIKGWTSPNLGEPDIYGTTDKGNIYDGYGASWAFKAKNGKHVAGLNVHNTREYIQGSLSQPLTVGKKYHFWFYVHYHCSGANNIGIAFLPQKADLKTDGVLPLKPVAYQKEVTKYSEAKTWALVRDSFIAYEPYQYFIIGNFFKDADTQLEGLIEHYFAYIDDVAVVESRDQKTGMPAVADAQKEKEKWQQNVSTVKKITETPGISLNDVSADTPITLDNVLFKVGTDELLPESIDALDNIIAQMKRNANVKINIIGHTSSEGTKVFNQALSEQRAQAVKNTMVQRGVDATRVTAVGMGETKPLEKGDTEEARIKNRRVEFEVIR